MNKAGSHDSVEIKTVFPGAIHVRKRQRQNALPLVKPRNISIVTVLLQKRIRIEDNDGHCPHRKDTEMIS